MPELAEVWIMSDFIRQHSDKEYNKAVEIDLRNKNEKIIIDGRFTLTSKHRGKELMVLSSTNHSIVFNMGMTGNWQFEKKLPKHTRYYFASDDGYLCFVDPRRFGRWSYSTSWGKNRSPDPVFEYHDFAHNVLDNINKFKKISIFEALMNQKYFNGIGNYLRAEILGRIDINPFNNLYDLYRNPNTYLKFFELLDLCKDIPTKAFHLNGGQLKDWKNPFDSDKKEFTSWLQFYNNKNRCNSILDKAGRKFWYDKKWEKYQRKNKIKKVLIYADNI